MDTSTTLPSAATGERRALHAVLVGLPGVGKSTVGRRVAKLLGRQFLDFDEEISRREGATINEIFAAKGEPYFRQREYELTRELSQKNAMILAPGGGWICQRQAVELLGGTGRTIYLRVTPEAVLQRLHRISERPLLAGDDPLGKLRELYSQRRALYETADATVDAETLTKDQLVAEVARVIAAFEDI